MDYYDGREALKERISSRIRETFIRRDRHSNGVAVLSVPNKLKFYHVPEDINGFIEEMLPRMRFMANIRLPDFFDRDEVVNNFIVYIKGNAPSKNGLERWKIYDSVKYPNMPYFRWFLFNMGFFCRLAMKGHKLKTQRETYISEFENDDSVDGISLVISSDSMDTEEIIDRRLMLDRFRKFLRNYSEVCQDKRPIENKFFSCSVKLFDLMLEDATNDEMSDLFEVSKSYILQWKRKVKLIANWWINNPESEAVDLITSDYVIK